MIKLLVNAPDGVQRLVEIQDSGGYFDPARVLWDERKDGLFPENLIPSVGGLIRNGRLLEVDAALLATHRTGETGRATRENQRAIRIRQAVQVLRDMDLTGPLSAGQIQQALGALIRIARND